MSWEKVKLSDVCEIIAGQSPPSSTYNSHGIGLPFFQGKADFGNDYPKVRMWCNKPNKISKPNDILLSVRAPVGPTNLCNVDSCIGRGLAAIRSRGKTDSKYVYYYFKSIEPVLSTKGNGSTFSAITTGDVKDLRIPLPPLHIQKQIANILGKADALRKKDQQLLQKYDELAQSIFIDMFGDPVKNEKGWEEKPFGSVFKSIRYGTGSPPEYSDSGIPFIRATNIKKGRIVEKDMVYISETEAEKITKCFVNEGDLIIVRSGVNTGDCGMINKEYDKCLAGYDLIIEIDNPYSTFYHFLINSVWGQRIIKPLSRRAAQPHLNSDQLKNISFILPHLYLLDIYREKLETILLAIKKIELSQKTSEDLFQSLLQKAFTGELIKE